MTPAILISSQEDRATQIRSSLADANVELRRQYSTTSALLTALPTFYHEIDLVIIDHVVEPMNAWDLAREITTRFPTIATIVVIDDPQPEDYSRAMDSNVRSVIKFPLQYEDVQHKVASALQWSKTVRSVVRDRSIEGMSPGRNGRMITLSGAKGGVGVSTLATHLAIEAQRSAPQKSVVLVDFDIQKPDVGIILNVPQYRTAADLLGVIDELTPQQVEDVLYKAPEGYSVLFGPQNGEESELVSEHAAQQILGMLRSRFDLVIVDTGSYLGESNSAAIEMADDAFIVSTSDVLSLRGAKRIGLLWKRLGIRPTENSKVILNKIDKKQDLQPEAAKKIVGLPVIPEYIPESIRSIELAMNRRDPTLVAPVWSNRIRSLGVEMGIADPAQLEIPTNPKKSKRKKKEKTKEQGSSSIELVGVTFFYAVIALLGFQALLVGMTWIFATGAANEGARAAAVGHSASQAAKSHTPGVWRQDMHVYKQGQQIHVTMQAPTIAKISDDLALKINTSAGIVREK